MEMNGRRGGRHGTEYINKDQTSTILIVCMTSL